MKILLAPSPALTQDGSSAGGGRTDSEFKFTPAGAAPPAEGLANLGSWMAGITGEPTTEKEKTNGTDDTTGRPGNDGPTDGVRVADNPPPEKGAAGKAAKAESERIEAEKAAKAKTDQDAAAAATKAKADAGKAKADETTTAATDADKIDEAKWPRTAADWDNFKAKHAARENKLRTEISTHVSRVKELETKLTETESRLKEKPAADPEVESRAKALEAENKALTEQIMVLDVTAHPKFKAYFDGKTQSAINKAKQIVGEENAAKVEKILNMTDPDYKQAQLTDLISELDTFQQSRLAVVVDQIEQINTERTDEIAKAEKHRETVHSERTAKQDQFKKAFGQTFENTVKELQDKEKGYVPFQKIDGNDAWNAQVDRRIEIAKAMVFGGKMNPQQIVRAAFDALSLPVVSQAYANDLKAWKEEKSKLEAQVKSLTAAQPGGGGGARKDGKEELRTEPKEGMRPFDFARNFAKTMVGEGAEP